jgi:2-polyprenyl-3-methyl-5-hydroxy-6-metoxy-1,4-benzoquinol methylase
MTTSPECRICKNTDHNKSYVAKEMMFGLREEFDYFQCSRCGCLQITTIPDDLAKYYPQHYFSFKRLNRSSQNLIRAYFDTHRVINSLIKTDWIGRVANLFSKPLNYLSWLRASKLGLNAKILDVGCGKGQLLLRMSLGGFKNCTGIDPYLQESINYANGVTIHKSNLVDFVTHGDSKFDLIMFHHSLEHMEDPRLILENSAKLLSAGGTILVRIPVADSYAWEHYGVNWTQLDAPRHLYLLTRDSMEKLAAYAHLKIDKVEYDSTPYQFVGSELYRRDIPMSMHKNRRKYFSNVELASFDAKTVELNETQKGDQAIFYLSHRSE